MPRWKAEAKKREEEKKAEAKKPQSSSVKNVNKKAQNSTFMGGGAPVKKAEKTYQNAKRPSAKARQVAEEQKRRRELEQHQNQKTYGDQKRSTPRRTTTTSNNLTQHTTAAQRQKTGMPTAEDLRQGREHRRALANSVKDSVRRATSEENKSFMQRQKSGIQTEADRQYSEKLNQRRAEVAKNTGRAATKGVQDTLTGYGKTLADVDEMAKSNKNWTRAKASKMGISEDDTVGMAKVEGERQKSIKQAQELRRDLAEKQDKRQAEFDERTKNAKGLEKAWYGAVESGTGMATDALVGALTGTGTAGSLASMGVRTYGTTRGQAEKEGATENEDRAYALLQAAKEVGTELMFPGAGLAKKTYGKVGLSVADRVANKLTKGLTGNKADLVGAGVRLLGGTAEENAEELAGWGLDPVIKELAYGKNVRTRQAQNLLKQESDELRSNLKSAGDARSVAAYLGSDRFLADNIAQYKDAGLSDKQAREVAEQMREYLTASLTGDTDRMGDLEDEIVTTVAGGSLKAMIKDYDVGELMDTFASTSVLTLATGLPATATTAMKGARIRENLGSEGLRALSQTAINFEDDEASLKGQAARDRLDSGKDLTSTQVFDLAKAQAEQIQKDEKRVAAMSNMADNAIKSEKLVTPKIGFRENGSVAGDEIITMNYVNESNNATEIISDLLKEKGSESLTDTEVQTGSRAIAGFKTGAFTVNDANALNYTNTTVRTAFEAATGVNLSQYVVRKNGQVDIPATNAATKDALFAMAADNFVKTAQAETANWMDSVKGDVVTQVTERMGAQGSLALQQALDDVDERDRSTYMMNANAADMMYQTARNMGTEWDSVKAEARKMFPDISETKLEAMYNAGLRDRADAANGAIGQQVRMGETMTLQNEPSEPKGKVFVDTTATPKGTVVRTFSEIASNLGVDIHLVDDLKTSTGGQANGQYVNGAIYINMNSDFESNIGYIFMHEVTHHLKQYAPEQFNELENLVREKWFGYNPEQMQNEIAKKIDLYKRNGQTLSEEEALEEIIADAAHEFINDRNFADQVAEQNPDIAKAILNGIRNALRMLRRLFASGSIDDETHMNSLFSQLNILDEAEKLWLNAYTQAVQNKAAVAIDEWQDRANNPTAVAIAEGEISAGFGEEQTRYSVREEDPPKNTIKAYKVFVAFKNKPGELYPPMVASPGGMPTPVGRWVNADTGELARNKDGSLVTTKKGRVKVQEGGKGTNKGKGGSLAWRPGWHLGSYPDAKQFAVKDPETGEARTVFPPNFVWAECEIAADNDYQLEALSYGVTEKGKFDRTQAGLPYIPKDGYYKYRTNADPKTVPWLITGAMKVNRILDDEEAREICAQFGATPMKRAGGDINLSDFGFEKGEVTPTSNEDLAKLPPAVDYSDEIRDLPGYVQREVNFDDPQIQKELAMNGQDADYYRALYEEQENTRYSIPTTSDDLVVQDGNARWTDERIDDLIERYGAKGSENYSQAYAVLMSPRDFLHITIEDELLRKWRESAASQENGLTYKEGQRKVWDKSYLEGRLLDDQNFPLDEAELRRQTQTPFLYIRSDKSGQRVLGHEGRHRMRALMEAGVTSVPVVIEDPDTKTSKQNVDSMILGYQEDVYNGAGIVRVNDLVPIRESNRDELIQKFGGDAQVRFSISPQQDADYMKAVNAGDMETAQRMVDEAAKMAMPNTKLKGRWYHGTENEFTEFNFSQGGKNGTADGFGIYLTNDPEVASSYGNRMIEGYVNVTRPASALTSQTLTKSELRRLIKRTVEDEVLQMAEDYDSNIEEAKFDTWISNYTDTRYAGNVDKAIDEVIKGITSYNGNDMDIIQEIMVGMGIRNYEEATKFYDILTETTGIDGFETKWGDESEMADPNTPTIALAFRSNQIKDASPVTYDDNGKPIPLSERFNTENEDIRYSLTPEQQQRDADYMDAVNSGNMDEAQRLVDEAADKAGMRVAHRYHGTMNAGFTVFDKAYAKVGGNSGAGFYFSTEKDDSVNHYADVEGADNYFKWSSLAEHINDQINEGTWEGPELETYEDVEEYAKEQLNKNPGTYDVYLNYKNPYIRDYKNSTNIYDMLMDDFDESVIDRDDYEDEWEYEDAVWEAKAEHLSDSLYSAVYGAYQDIEDNYEVIDMPYIDEVLSKITEYAFDGSLTWEEIQNGIVFAGEVEVTNPNWTDSGDATSEFTRAIIENLGFDAIEDKEVSSKFGQLSREMMTDTEHIIVFKPEQIKLSDPITYAEDGSVIPLSERFDPTNNDIRYSLPTQDSDGNILTDGQMEFFKNSQARDIFGRLVPVYHATDMGGFTIFDPWKSDDHRSLFFSNRRDVAKTYAYNGGNAFDFEPKQINNWNDLIRYGRQLFSDADMSWDNDTDDNNLGFELYDKETGNFADIGYDEWLSLVESNDPHADDYKVKIKLPYNNKDGETEYVSFEGDSAEDLLNKVSNGNIPHGGHYQVYLNLENPLIIDGQGQPWNNIVNGGSVFPAYSSITLRNRSWFEDEAESRDKMYELGQSLYNGDNARARAQEFEGDEYVEIEIFNGRKKNKAIIPLTEEAVAEEAAAAFGVDDLELLQGVASEIVGDMEFGNTTKIYDDDMRNTIGEYGYNTREWAEFAEDEGHDGVIFRNIIDIDNKTEMFDSEEESASDIYVAFSSNQVKDINNENPTENPDIRYSIPDEDETMNLAQDKAKTTDDVWATDPVTQEGRIRKKNGKQDFINGVTNKWNPAWKTEGKVLKDSSVEKAVRDVIMGAMRESNTTARYRQSMVKKTMLVARQAFNMMKNDEYAKAAELLYDHAYDMIENLEFFGNDDKSEFERYKELREYLRTTKITVPEDKRSDIDYASFRKKNFGKILLGDGGTAPDVAWQRLNELWPEAFTEDIKGDAASIMLQMENALDIYEPYATAYSSEQCVEFAGDIADSLYDIIYEGEEYKSLADKYTDKSKAMKARHAEAMEKVKQNYKDRLNKQRLDAKRKEYARLEAQKERITNKYEERLSNVKDKYERKIRAQKRKADFEIATLKQNREYNIQRLKAEKARAVKEERQRGAYKRAESLAKQREKQMHRQLYNRVIKEYNDLTHRLLHPTKDKAKNIPEQLRQPLAQMLHCFDLEKERSKKLEEMYMIPTRSQLNFRELKDAFEKVIKEDPTAYELSDVHKYMADKMTELADRVDGKSIDALDIEDIKVVKDLLVGLNAGIKNAQQLEIDGENYQKQQMCDKVGEGAAEHQKLYGKAKKYGSNDRPGIRAYADHILNMGELTPIYFFRQIKGMYDMYRQMRKGFNTYVRNEKNIINKIADILSDYYKTNRKGERIQGSEIEEWRHSESAETFPLMIGNQTITLTIAQKMSLYCLAKRSQAQMHMYSENGGIVASETSAGSKIHQAEERYKGKTVEYKPVYLTPADVDAIISTLTEDQKTIADQLQKLMSTDMAELGNEASVKLTGIEMYKEQDYFPIKVMGESLPTNPENIGIREKIRNPGFSNPLQENASNPIIVDDIFAVVASHCNEMNQYASYAVPITNFMKVYNGSVINEEGKAVKIKTVLKETYGEKALTYIENFIDDINGNSFKRHGGIDDVLDKVLGQAKKAAVFANLRVALQQPTAIVRALAVMNPKYFRGVRPSTKATKEMIEHCPIAQWKALGYFDTHFGRDIEDVMMGRDVSSKADQLMSDIYGQLDNMTWGMIWQAVKNEIRATHKGIDETSQEFWDLCEERASFVFDSTQVVDSPFHRSNDMRSKDRFVKQLTSFQAEPTLSFNVLRQGFVDAYEALKKGDSKKARRIVERVLGVWVAQALTVALAQSIVDALRRKGHKKKDDDEDEMLTWYQEFVKYFFRNFGNNFKDDLNPINNIYFVKDIVPPIMNAIKGEYVYGTQSLTTQWVDTLTNGISMCKKKWEKGDADSHTWYDCLTELFGGLGYLKGIPAKTMMRGTKNAFHWAGKIFGINVFADDGKAVDKAVDSFVDKFRGDESEGEGGGLFDSIANKMGYRKSDESSGDTKESKADSADIDAKLEEYEESLSDTYTDKQKDKLVKQYKKTLEKEAVTEAAMSEDFDVQAHIAEAQANFDYEMEKRSIKAAEMAAGKTGRQRDEALWDVIAEGYTKSVDSGNMATIQRMREEFAKQGGDTEWFDAKIADKMKSAYKKTLYSSDEIVPGASLRQETMYNFMTEHGVSETEISDIVYHSYVARDLKAAMRIGNEDYIMDELVPLVAAGLSREDYEKLYKYRNMGAKTYDGKYTDPKYTKTTGTFVWPTEGVITSHFGWRNAPTAGASSNHPAIDIGAPSGTTVVAADGGVVITAGANGGYGNSVGIKHANGMVTYYNHLSAWNVKVGDQVAQGQPIANVGSTGISTGPHLDFKILDADGNPVDPEKYLNKRS